jgi:hypothetical protein
MLEAPCPSCGTTHELYDVWDENPAGPYSQWPGRWGVHDGEGGTLCECACGEDLLDAAGAMAASVGMLPDYPWRMDDRALAVFAEAAQGRTTYPLHPAEMLHADEQLAARQRKAALANDFGDPEDKW